MLKKTKFYVGITLIVQALSFMAMFVMLCRKKKSLAGAILAIAIAGGVTGALLLYLDSKDELKRRKITAARDACCGDDFDEFFMDSDDEDLAEYYCDGDLSCGGNCELCRESD